MSDKRTTETLRAKLLDAIEAVEAGDMDISTARTIAQLADKVIATARLELEHALTLSKLDKEDQGVAPGPLLLANGK